MSSLTVARAPESRSSRGSVLVVDDEPTVAEVVSRHLQRAGYATQIAADGATAMDAATSLHPDLIVLDVKRPRIDGLEMMRQLRSEDHMTPAVIMLSGRGGESDRVIGLRSGADDYVVKPFSPLELVARVEAILRRAQPGLASEAVLEVGEIRIDRAARRVVVRGSEVRLAQKEYDLLLYLAQHQGQAFSRDDLIRAVWRYSFY
ncbi:MAG: response regulator transcription factor, partial [Solirubrobacterales bacterium]|nr:response regulator transcription factor [Solirubrobacterales bacterium]